MSPGFWGVAKTSEAELASACLGLKIFARKLGCAGTKSRVDESRLDEERPLEEVLALKDVCESWLAMEDRVDVRFSRLRRTDVRICDELRTERRTR